MELKVSMVILHFDIFRWHSKCGKYLKLVKEWKGKFVYCCTAFPESFFHFRKYYCFLVIQCSDISVLLYGANLSGHILRLTSLSLSSRTSFSAAVFTDTKYINYL